MSRLAFFGLVLAGWLVGIVRGHAGDPPPMGFAGECDTTYGRLTLRIEGEKATGRCRFGDGPVNELAGSVAGDALRFTYSEPDVTGEGAFTLAEGGQSFTGRWREDGASRWQSWGGRRVAAAALSFCGVWKTSYGLMRLIQTGEKIRGCSTYGERSELTGSVKGGTLVFTYREPSGTTGRGRFTLDGGFQGFGTQRTACRVPSALVITPATLPLASTAVA